MRKNYVKMTYYLIIHICDKPRKKNPEILDRSKWWN